jgi:hypothetical protein
VLGDRIVPLQTHRIGVVDVCGLRPTKESFLVCLCVYVFTRRVWAYTVVLLYVRRGAVCGKVRRTFGSSHKSA